MVVILVEVVGAIWSNYLAKVVVHVVVKMFILWSFAK